MEPLSVRFGAAGSVVAAGVALPRGLEQLRGRINPDHFDADRCEHSAEPTLATPDIECMGKSAGADTAEHHRIEHVLLRPVTPLAHGSNPCLRRTVPAVAHDATSLPSHRCFNVAATYFASLADGWYCDSSRLP